MRTDEHAIIMQDRLILATGALERIRALGGSAGKIAAETLLSFARADASDGPIDAASEEKD